MVDVDEVAERVRELARDDPDLARAIQWRRHGYRLEVRARIRERFGLDVGRRTVTRAVGQLDHGFLVENARYGPDEIESPVRGEFDR